MRVFPCLQMMPEIRVALFGANPNRKFLDWVAPLYQGKTLLFIFYFVIWKTSFLCLWNEFLMQKRRIVVVWCIAVFSCALRDMIDAAAQRYRCASWVLHSCNELFTLLLPLWASQFTLIIQGRQYWVTGWMLNRLSSNWISFHDKHSVTVFPVSLTSTPHYKLHGALCC